MKTTTKVNEKINFTVNKKLEELEPVLMHTNTERIASVERAIMDLIPVVQGVYDAFKGMTFGKDKKPLGKLTIGEIQKIKSMCDLNTFSKSDSLQRLRTFIIEKVKQQGIKLDFGPLEVSLESLIISGAVELPGLESLLSSGNYLFNVLGMGKYKGAFNFNYLTIENDEVVVNQEEYNRMKEGCKVWAKTQKQIDCYNRFKVICDELNICMEKKYITDENFNTDERYIVKDAGKFRPNYGHIVRL